MAKFITAPADALEVVIGTMWPINWGYWLLAGVGILGLAVKPQARGIPKVLLYLPAAWLAWQLVAITTSSDRELSLLTSLHFASTLACFYLGMLCLARCPDLNRFWVPLAISFCLVLLVGWGQRFGGLEKTREYFFTYIYPTMPDVSPEYVKKMQSTRIFSTLFYPNALAGVILLFLPPLLAWIAGLRDRFTLGARTFLVCALTVGALACLYWSGSQGGWLLLLG
ncbi:hypothetical protein EG829_30315, partial [bacterium]|nr:hypothetical protein [bacterium]